MVSHPFAFEDDAKDERPLHGGVQYKFAFDNGYGASVVQHEFSYGGDDGQWELAVLGPDGHLTYDTPVTDDVIGRLDETTVGYYLDQIKALSPVAVDR